MLTLDVSAVLYIKLKVQGFNIPKSCIYLRQIVRKYRTRMLTQCQWNSADLKLMLEKSILIVNSTEH